MSERDGVNWFVVDWNDVVWKMELADENENENKNAYVDGKRRAILYEEAEEH